MKFVRRHYRRNSATDSLSHSDSDTKTHGTLWVGSFAKLTIGKANLFIRFVLTVDAWTISFSPDGRFLGSGSHTGKVNLYGVDSGKKEQSLDTRGL